MLTITIALILVMVTSLPLLVATVIKFTLIEQGMVEPAVIVETIGFKKAHIKTLQFSTKLQQTRIDASMQNVVLQYSLSGLLAGGLERILVPTTDIVITDNTGSEKKSGSLKIVNILPVVSQFPFQSLVFDQIHVTHAQTDMSSRVVDISGYMEVLAEEVRAKFSFRQNKYKDVSADIKLSNTGLLHVGLRDNEQQVQWMALQASQMMLENNQTQIQVTTHIDLAKGFGLLRAWGIAEQASKTEGKLDSNISILLPMEIELTDSQWLQAATIDADLDIDMSMQKWQGLANSINAKLSMRASLKDETVKWNIDKDSYFICVPEVREIVKLDDSMLKLTGANKKQTLAISLPENLAGRSSITENMILTAEKNIELQYGDIKTDQGIKLILDALQIDIRQGTKLSGLFEFSAHSNEAGIIYADSVSAQTKGELVWNKEALELEFNAGAKFTVTAFKYDDFKVKSVVASLSEKAKCRYSIDNESLMCGMLNMNIQPVQAIVNDMTAMVDSTTLSIQNFKMNHADYDFDLITDASKLKLMHGGFGIKIDKIKSVLEYRNRKLAAKGTLQAAAGDVNGYFDIQHDLAVNIGQLNYKLVPINFSTHGGLPSRLFVNDSLPIRLNAGRLSASGHLSWRSAHKINQSKKKSPQLYKQLNMNFDKLGGHYSKTTFSGLSTQFELQGTDSLSFKLPAQITIDQLNPGLAITDIKLWGNFKLGADYKPVIIVKNMQAESFGGTISADIIDIDFRRTNNPFILQFNHFDIKRLLELEQSQGLSGTGLIDGKLPFNFNSTGLSMLNGSIEARVPGGVLQYVAPDRVKSMAQSNPNIKLLLGALSNFNYSQLNAKTNYSPDGKLVLNVALKGNNPDFQKGKPIHLNINVEENILTLLRSLQLGDELSDSIGEHLNKRRQNQ